MNNNNMEGILKYQNKNYYSSFHYTDYKRNMKFFILILRDLFTFPTNETVFT